MDAATTAVILAHVAEHWKRCACCGAKVWAVGDVALPIVGDAGVAYYASVTCAQCKLVSLLDRNAIPGGMP